MAAHDYPLLIKNLLLVPARQPTRNRIVYRDVSSYDYRTFGERVARLGSALTRLGVRPGDTVAVMDWTRRATSSASSPSPCWARCCRR
jgi:fatty-acyl-CoA synthase